MAEETGSVDAGNPAPEASATPAETSAPEAAPAPGRTPDAPNTDWIGGVPDGDVKDWAISKGLQNGSYANVLGSYRNLESMMGADKAGRTVVLLGDDATPEQRNEFYTKLGRPETAADYGLAPPAGEDGAFAEWASNTFHGAGLTDKQAKIISESWESYRGTTEKATNTAAEVSRNDAIAQLKTDWGAAYEQKIAGIDVAATKLGFTLENLEGLRSSMGPVAAMKFIDNLNSKMGDHNFDTGESVVSNEKTPDQAKTELNELSMNKEFMDAWLDKQHPGHNAAVNKKSALARQATGLAA